MSDARPGRERDDSQPLEGFVDCHVGIIGQLDQLGELPGLLEPAARARQIARDTIEFFHSAVFAHHADEERELFSLVQEKARPGEERVRVQRLVGELVAQHRQIEDMWRALEPRLRNVAKGRPDPSLESEDITLLVRAYHEHAALEEREFLPLSSEILGRDETSMSDLGLSLHLRHAVRAARRGLRGS